MALRLPFKARESGCRRRGTGLPTPRRIFRHFQQQYASDEMRDDLRELRSWLLWCNERGLDVAIEWEKQWEINPEAYPNVHAKARAVDASRRRVSHFFGAIAELYSQRLLGEPLARVLANYSGIDLLFLVVEPLESRLGAYERSQVDTLASLTGYSGPKSLIVGQAAIRRRPGQLPPGRTHQTASVESRQASTPGNPQNLRRFRFFRAKA
jgi:hypothetical protein